MSHQPPVSNYKSLIGFVTKLVGDGATYGFINDEIFFQQANVTGGPTSVGDQVVVECEYSDHLPIKWNATSVKILAHKSGQQMASTQPPPQQQQPQQQQSLDTINPQLLGSPSSVAVTYQQHRQQRLQRQLIESKQPENKPPQQNFDLTNRLLEQANNPGDYMALNDPRSQPLPPDSSMQTFQEQPMGPPKFAFTSQLGSAFVQNQFVPTPFINQPPPSTVLPQQQQPQQQQQQQQQQLPQQHHIPSNQPHNNQRHGQQNKGPGGQRFNNQNDRYEGRFNRNNRNRSDNYDRPRSGERDNSYNNNNRSSRNNDYRDKSSGRGQPRKDETVARHSPVPQASSRSSVSVGSERGTKNRRHYEIQNLPKTQIMVNLNAYNMKQRCPSTIHIPSDLKEIHVNRYFRLDIRNIPKPIKFIIESHSSQQNKKDETVETKDTSDEKVDTETTEAIDTNQDETNNEKEISSIETEATDTKLDEIKCDNSIQEKSTPIKSEFKLNHKYGVKVLLISIPEMKQIYQSVFGSELSSNEVDLKSNKKLDEKISLLCTKASNNGYSLFGGKFDPNLDGYMENVTNNFEKHGRQPNLIATCKRVVLEQTSLDLGSCKSWTLISTFVYNNRSDYFSSKASIEYSFIYLPQIWTMASETFDKTILNKRISQESNNEAINDQISEEAPEINLPESEIAQTTEEHATSGLDINMDSSIDEIPKLQVTLETIADLKVVDLKGELDKRGIKYKPNAKKAELVELLREHFTNKDNSKTEEASDKTPELSEDFKNGQGEQKMNADNSTTDTLETDTESILEQTIDENEAASCETMPTSESCGEQTLKRKAPSLEPETKRVCVGQLSQEKPIELIREPFTVRGRDEQQKLSLVSLYDVSQVSRYDQFELSLASIILKESLTQHLSEYILTALVENYSQKVNQSATTNLSDMSSSQESDTNNNHNSDKQTNTVGNDTLDQGDCLKELPMNRYINLAFSYFDSAHMGFIYMDDLSKLFNNTNLTISKRALIALIGDGEKFHYRTLPDLSLKTSPDYIYQFPAQFEQFLSNGNNNNNDQSSSVSISNIKMIEFKGVTYDVEKLIRQVKDAELLRINLVDRFNYAIENSDKQTEEIHVLEVSQKSLSKAIKTQNDEICDLKRERDSLKKKLDTLKKGIKGSITSLSGLIKDEK